MDISEVNRLLDLGFTAEYIMGLDAAPAQAPAPRADPEPSPAADPEPAPVTDPVPAPAADPEPAPATIPGLDVLTQQIANLTRALQASNIKSDIIDNPPQTAEDILGAALVNAPKK